MGFNERTTAQQLESLDQFECLAATLLTEEDEDRRRELVQKVLRSLDRFFMPYPPDGSCDEGPSYWGRAGASLFENLELLHSATQGKFDVYDDVTVQDMGRYIYRMHVARDAFVCVGDCDVRPDVPRDLLFRYGQRIEDAQMQALARSGQVGDELWREARGPWSMMRLFYAVFDLIEPAFRSGRTAADCAMSGWATPICN